MSAALLSMPQSQGQQLAFSTPLVDIGAWLQQSVPRHSSIVESPNPGGRPVAMLSMPHSQKQSIAGSTLRKVQTTDHEGGRGVVAAAG